MNLPSLRFSPPSLALGLLAAIPLALPAQNANVPPPIVPSPPTLQTPAAPASSPAAPAPAAAAAPAAGEAAAKTPSGGIILNFQGAALNDVLNYLSEAAGFVIVQETPVSGTVNIVSRQPLNPDEAVDLVNTVLVEKGFIGIRNGRILKIVSRANAQKRDLPVMMGSDPAQIPRKDEMVTQILPLRFGEAAKVIENLRPLLSESASMSANESSNAIILTDTQTNIHRVAQIIRALDTSVSSISTITVFPLKFADAKEVATVLAELFSSNASSTRTSQQGSDRGRRGGFGFGGFLGFGGAPSAPAGGSSEARAANTRIVAVADEQSNSVIVSAPEEVIPTIRQIVNQIDTSIQDVTDTRIFRLEHADAVELAGILNSLFAETGTQSNNAGQNRRGDRRSGQQSGGGFPFPFGGGQPAQGSAQSERSLLQSRVVAVGDPRTNSLLVTAAQATMTQIAEMVGRLDATEAKKQRVYVHSLEHADAESVANVLRGMLGEQVTTQSATSRLSDRSATGATLDTSNAQSQGLGGGRAR
jgi:type II secretory pathway component GspD/PulD (secretin)